MSQRRVIFTPEAQSHLAALFRYIAVASSPEIARGYTGGLVDYCENLRDFPLRGSRRDEVFPGLRLSNYRRRTVIAFTADAELVSIVGVFHGGQNYEAMLLADPTDP